MFPRSFIFFSPHLYHCYYYYLNIRTNFIENEGKIDTTTEDKIFSLRNKSKCKI